LPDKEHKTRKKTIAKKSIKSHRVTDRVLRAKPAKKKSLKKKIEKKVIKKGKKGKKVEKKQKTIIPPVPGIQSTPGTKSIQGIQSTPGTQHVPIIPDVPGTQYVQDVQIVPSVHSRHFLPSVPKINILITLFFMSIILFFVGGYFYPATSEDMASNNVIWAGNDGKYDRGLFSQFYASIAFTFGVILLGYYVNSTFIRFNIKYWNYFLIGILLMFFFGLGKIGELVFNHSIFEGFKNLILPVALMILAFASYKIYKNMVGGI
jgi:hypothetical protein